MHYSRRWVVGLCQEGARELERSFELLGTWPISERGQMPQPLLVSCLPALGDPLGHSQETQGSELGRRLIKPPPHSGKPFLKPCLEAMQALNCRKPDAEGTRGRTRLTCKRNH